MTLREIIAERIRHEGPLRFSAYMEMALYHPQLGYYAGGARRVGRGGDFITSVSTGAAFGELLGAAFCQVWESLDRPAEFTLIEQGADDGRLAADILTWASRERPDFAASLQLRLREPLPALRAAQTQTLRDFADRVTWTMEPAACGMFFANELLDALPVDRWVRRGGAWHEVRTALQDDGFIDVEYPADDLPDELKSMETADLPEGYLTETCPGLAACVRSAVQSLESGGICFADYGMPAEELRAPHRTAGSLRGYRAHRREDDPYADPGGTDLTVHVDWTAVERAVQDAGAEIVELTDQGRWLTRLAADRLRRMDGRVPDAADQKWLRQFRTLTHPAQLGRVFQILTARRGMI